MNIKKTAIMILFALFASATAESAVYEVKPGTAMTEIAQVPWATLQPGDTVLIHWRPQPYREKWVICRQGTAELPITVRGVSGPNGEFPVIDGINATTPVNLNFWSEQRGVIKIGGANVPADTMPRHIIIEGLEVRGAHPNYSFTNRNGQTQNYTSAASPIFIEKGENITIRNNIITDGANGLFVASAPGSISRNIIVEQNHIYGNGIVGSAFQHNNYTAAIGITFQYNQFGPLRSGAGGNALKDRSAGTVVRYNWIESGNRQLDLVDAEDAAEIRNSPDYSKTFVYGNILIEPEGAGNSQISHYGGDSGATANYRKGTLYFYNNTIVSTRSGNTTFLRLSTNDEFCDARNNIIFTQAAGTTLAMLAESGTLNLVNNWAKNGWRNSHNGAFDGTITGGGTTVTGTSPGFADLEGQNFTMQVGSQAIDAGAALHPDVLPLNNVISQYVKHRAGQARPGFPPLDIGAYESGSSQQINITTNQLPNALRVRTYFTALEANGGAAGVVWSISEGTLPPGLWLDAKSGRITGRARLKGVQTFTIRAEELGNQLNFAEKQFTIITGLY